MTLLHQLGPLRGPLASRRGDSDVRHVLGDHGRGLSLGGLEDSVTACALACLCLKTSCWRIVGVCMHCLIGGSSWCAAGPPASNTRTSVGLWWVWAKT